LNHKTFSNVEGSWESIMTEATQWLGQHLYPHQIVHFTVYEDEHSLANEDIKVTVYYRGAENSSLAIPEDVNTPIYSHKLIVQGGEWVDAIQWGLDTVNELGLRETRSIPATANKELDNEKVVAVLYWSRAVEDSMNTRSGGCCAIF